MERAMQMLMKRYQLVAWMGALIVVIAFLAALGAAGANAEFFGVDKLTREAAATGSELARAHAAAGVARTWVPAFKFVGLGLLLGAITMALGLIATSLRGLGIAVTERWPGRLRPPTPAKPASARLFPMLMMLGVMVLLAGLVWALGLTGVVGSYWNHAVATELNPAQPGSTLLGQLGTIRSGLTWLAALRFLGMALLLSGITVALTVILRTLQTQEGMLERFLEARARGA